MSIEFRRMVGIVSMALFVLVVLLAIGDKLASPPDSTRAHLPLQFIIPFLVWMTNSSIAKLGMINSVAPTTAKVFTGLAVVSGGVMVVLNDMGDVTLSPTVGGIVAVAWFLSWLLIDLTDLLIPSSWWKK